MRTQPSRACKKGRVPQDTRSEITKSRRSRKGSSDEKKPLTSQLARLAKRIINARGREIDLEKEVNDLIKLIKREGVEGDGDGDGVVAGFVGAGAGSDVLIKREDSDDDSREQ